MSSRDAFLTATVFIFGAAIMCTLLYSMLSDINVENETIKGEIIDMWQDDNHYWVVIKNNNGHYFSIEVTTDTYYENNVGDHVKLRVMVYSNGDYCEVDA